MSRSLRFKPGVGSGVGSGVSGGSAPCLDPDPLAGVYHTMEEHLKIATSLTSPADFSDRLPDTVRRNIFSLLTEDPVVSKRLKTRSKPLQNKEQTAR